MKTFFNIFIDQLREPVDRRTQYILYAVLGLLSFFIVDNTILSISDEMETMISEQETRTENLEVSVTQLTVLQFTRERINDLERELQAAKAQNLDWVGQLQQCTESSLITIIESSSAESSPFENYTVSPSTRMGNLETIGYTLSLAGSYADIIQFVGNVSESPCGLNLTEWTMNSNANPGEDYIESTIDLRLVQAMLEDES